MAYKRQVSEQMAESYALKNDMAFFEVSPLCDFNVTESFAELSRVALKRNGMRRTWGTDKGIFFWSQTCCYSTCIILVHVWSSITLYRHTHIVLWFSNQGYLFMKFQNTLPHACTSWQFGRTSPHEMYCVTVNWQKATSFKIWNRISKNLLFCFAVLSLKEIACRCIVANTTIYGIDRLPLPHSLTSHLKSYALTNKTRVRMQSFVHRKIKYLNPTDTPPAHCRQSCCIS